jgi:hypothetical protein
LGAEDKDAVTVRVDDVDEESEVCVRVIDLSIIGLRELCSDFTGNDKSDPVDSDFVALLDPPALRIAIISSSCGVSFGGLITRLDLVGFCFAGPLSESPPALKEVDPETS